MELHSPGSSSNDPGAKVAIPRIRQQPLPSCQPKKHAREPRIMTACNMCRKRRVRCSGHHPRCTYCQKNNADCVYGHPRRDRLKVAMQWNRSFAAFLRDLRSCVHTEAAMRIDQLLAAAEKDLFPASSGPSVGPSSQSGDQLGVETSDIPSSEPLQTRTGNCRDTLESQETHQSLSRRFSDAGHHGRSVEAQRLQDAHGPRSKEDVESFNRRYSYSGSSQATVDEWSRAVHEDGQTTREQPQGLLTGTPYHLYNNNIRTDYNDPGSGTVEPLHDCYFNATLSTFPQTATEFDPDHTNACNQQDTVDHFKLL